MLLDCLSDQDGTKHRVRCRAKCMEHSGSRGEVGYVKVAIWMIIVGDNL
jgi:hypothetical protein